MRLNPTNISIIKRLLVGRNSRPLKSILRKLPIDDCASLFSLVSEREQGALIDALMSIDKATETLVELSESQLEDLLRRSSFAKKKKLVSSGAEDRGAYLMMHMEPSDRDQILSDLDPARAERLRLLMTYPDNSAGQMMSTDVFSLPVTLTAAEAMEQLRLYAEKGAVYYIYVVGSEGDLCGVLSLRALATAPVHTSIRELTRTEVVTVPPEAPAERVAQAMSSYGLVAIPVVNDERHLLGVVPIDEVLDIIQEQAASGLYARAGLQADDRVYSPPLRSVQKRIPWMLLNLALASIASYVVSLFEATMSELIILATLNNIVAGLGGNTAVQALTVVTRGLSTGDFDYITYLRAVLKEAYVGVSIGVVMGFATGLLVLVWKGSLLVGIVICIALILNSIWASVLGASVPILLSRWGRDPALGSGVLVTTLTDIFGFFSFLGIATIGLYLVS